MSSRFTVKNDIALVGVYSRESKVTCDRARRCRGIKSLASGGETVSRAPVLCRQCQGICRATEGVPAPAHDSRLGRASAPSSILAVVGREMDAAPGEDNEPDN